MSRKSYNLAIAVLTIATAFTFIACTACQGNPPLKKASMEETDSVIQRTVSDSIYHLLTKSKEIRAFVLDIDTASHKRPLRLNRMQRTILRFIITDAANYQSDITVYGKFMANFQLEFRHKGNVCLLHFDFGLKKWQLCSKNGEVLKQYDLKTNDMLRLAHMIFPTNDLINELINVDRK